MKPHLVQHRRNAEAHSKRAPLRGSGAYGGRNEARRQQWLKARLAAVPRGSVLLDAGAGELQNRALCRHLEYVSQDFCAYDGQGDGRGLQCGGWDCSRIDIVSDICSIPVPDGSFDAILCSEVLEHLPDPIRALEELVRVLRDGGELIVTAPTWSLTHQAPHYYGSGFSRYFYEHALPSLGAEITEMTPNGDWFECVAQELLRLPSMIEEAAGVRLGRLGRIGVRLSLTPLLVTLRECSWRAPDANELLSFGWHVVAVKRGAKLPAGRAIPAGQDA